MSNSFPGLSGNPHADALKLHQDFGNTMSPSVQATLALAFEVRTANLQAVQKMTLDMLLNPNFNVANEAEAAAEIDSLNDQINSRLGMGGDDS